MLYLLMAVTLMLQQFWEDVLLVFGTQLEHLLMDQQIQIGNYLSGSPIMRLLTPFVLHLFNSAVLLYDSCKHVIRLGVQHLPSSEVHR